MSLCIEAWTFWAMLSRPTISYLTSTNNEYYLVIVSSSIIIIVRCCCCCEGQWPFAGIASQAWLIWLLSAVPHNRRIGWQGVTNYKRANFQNKKSSRPNCVAWQTSSEALYSLIPTFCLSTSAWLQFRLGKPSQKRHIFFWALHTLPPHTHFGQIFTFKKLSKSKSVIFNLGRGVPCLPIGRFFSLWKRCKIILSRSTVLNPDVE